MLRVTVGVHAAATSTSPLLTRTRSSACRCWPPGRRRRARRAERPQRRDACRYQARISATHSPENGAEKTEKSERELHYDVKYPYDLSHEEVSDTDKALAAAMEAIADGPSIAVLKTILANQDVLELVGAHSHIGSNIHDADASFTRPSA